MKPNIFLKSLLICFIAAGIFSCVPVTTKNAPAVSSPRTSKEIPHLKKQGEATQLIVDGKPFLLLAGELHNSSSSSREYMKDIWPKLKSSGMNTVLAAVEWSLVEPSEGKFDFTVVDNLIDDARTYDLKLVLLWFGAWKNGQSHYMPEWVKSDYKRFPRVKAESGKSLEIVSALGKETLLADSRAFAAMMKHIKEIDSSQRTVIMIQVQNEAGILGSPRDHSEIANAEFTASVPQELMDYLIKNKSTLLPELLEVWKTTSFKTSGTWEEVFGKGVKTDEFFMAWNYARYFDVCAKSAKAEYSIPMFVNAWIVQPEDKRPGDYPSGGPQAHVLDFYRAGASNIDLLCPDIYLPDFADICSLYARNNNTLFIPESMPSGNIKLWVILLLDLKAG
jgi:beta-galactosidase GanA